MSFIKEIQYFFYRLLVTLQRQHFSVYYFTIVVSLAVLGVLFIFLLWKSQKIKFQVGIYIVALFTYIALVLGTTVFCRPTKSIAEYELTPFWSYIQALKGSYVRIIENVLNIIMMIPIGILIRMINTFHKTKHWIIWSLCFCYMIELLQLALKKGMFELFDDPFNNMVGIFLGYFCCAVIYKLARRRKNDCYKECEKREFTEF